MSLVTDIIDDARAYASESFDNAEDYLVDAGNRIGYAYPADPNYAAQDTDIITPEWREPDNFNSLYIPPKNTSVKPVFQNPVLPEQMKDIEDIGEFDGNINLVEMPDVSIAEFSGTAPVMSVVKIPEAPDLIQIPFPEIDTIEPPVFNGIVLPVFDPDPIGEKPGAVPDISAAYESAYKSYLPEMKDFVQTGMEEILNKYCPEYDNNRDRLVQKVNSAYDTGTGLSDTFQQNLYDEGRAKAEEEANRINQQIQVNAAKSGFFTPPGSMQAALVKAQSDAAMNNAQYASQITMEREKLELNHLEFVMQLSNGIRESALQLAVQHANTLLQVNKQAIESSMNVANTITENYNLQLKLYSTSMQYLSIQAQVYETEYKSAMADLEIYKIEVEAAKLSLEIDSAEIALYEARIKAQTVELEQYSIQVQAIEVKVQAESAAVTAFSAEVDAYNAMVKAKVAEVEVYKAAIEGNKILVDIYATEVSAYKTRVEAEKSKVDVQISTTQSVTEYNKSLSDQYNSELKAYVTDIQAESTRFKSEVEAYTSGIAAYKADIATKVSGLNADVSIARLNVSSEIARFRSQSDFNVAWARAITEGNKNVADIAQDGAETYAQIAAASLQAQNTMVKLEEQSSDGV